MMELWVKREMVIRVKNGQNKNPILIDMKLLEIKVHMVILITIIAETMGVWMVLGVILINLRRMIIQLLLYQTGNTASAQEGT